MTDYTASDTTRDSMSSNQRTSNWVYHHAPPLNSHFYSPSMPPSPIDDLDAMSYAPSESDAESSHSVPPRMIVRYADGTDVAISEEYHRNDNRRSAHHAVPMSRAPSRHPDAEALSHYALPNSGPAFQSGQQRHISAPQPSRGPFMAAQPSAHMSSVPSRIIPRPHTVQPSLRAQEEIRVLPPSNHTMLGATPVTTSYSQPSTQIRKTPPPGSITYSQSHPPSKREMRNASAYANMQYQQMTANGFPNRYPHSSAVHHSSYSSSGGHHPVTYDASNSNRHRTRTRAPSGSGPRYRAPSMNTPDSWSVIEEEEIARRNPRSSYRDLSIPRRRDHSSSQSSDPPSLDYSGSTPTSRSQSTYYVAASPKQKVRLLEPEKSVFFSNSTTKSPTSAHHNPSSQWSTAGVSGGGFFSRLFRGGSIKKPSPDSIINGRNNSLSRRHSIGGLRRN